MAAKCAVTIVRHSCNTVGTALHLDIPVTSGASGAVANNPCGNNAHSPDVLADVGGERGQVSCR
ncbi:MAG: hypothetical protein ACR2JD_00825 [Nocardioides sp.]